LDAPYHRHVAIFSTTSHNYLLKPDSPALVMEHISVMCRRLCCLKHIYLWFLTYCCQNLILILVLSQAVLYMLRRMWQKQV